MKQPKFAMKTLVALLVSTVVIFAIHVLLKYISVRIFNEQHGSFYELSARFDVNDENSVPQWFSQLLFMSVGLSALFAAYLNTTKSGRTFWVVVGVIGVLLSLDDSATLHEYVLQNLHNTFFLDTAPSFFVNAWLIILPFVLFLGSLLAWWAWRVLPKRTMVLLVIGGATYVLGKIMMDSLANTTTDMFLDRGIMQGLEKIFQYTGISIVLYAILDYLERQHGSVIARAVRQLKQP